MESFELYLRSRGYRASTQKIYVQVVQQYVLWCAGAGVEAESASYRDVLRYCGSLRERGVRSTGIKRYLVGIGHWYGSKGLVNPGRDIVIREQRGVGMQELLDEGELRGLYHGYRSIEGVSVRNVVMVGMMVYQGLHGGSLKKLRVQDVDMVKGEFSVLGSSRSAERVVPLLSEQMAELREYLHGKQNGLLFTCKVENVVAWIYSQLSKARGRKVDALLVRRSVIVYWIGRYGLRQAQYMAGHKYISSTERYQSGDIASLQRDIARLHPLG